MQNIKENSEKSCNEEPSITLHQAYLFKISNSWILQRKHTSCCTPSFHIYMICMFSQNTSNLYVFVCFMYLYSLHRCRHASSHICDLSVNIDRGANGLFPICPQAKLSDIDWIIVLNLAYKFHSLLFGLEKERERIFSFLCYTKNRFISRERWLFWSKMHRRKRSMKIWKI